MHGSKQVNLHAQRGVSLSGLIVVLGVVAAVAMLGMKVFPSILEYKAAKDAIAAAKNTNGSVQDIHLAFNKNADINAITTIAGRDLIISRDSGETEVSFDYEKKIPLFTNVHLVIRYAATTDKSGVIPEKPEAPPQ